MPVYEEGADVPDVQTVDGACFRAMDFCLLKTSGKSTSFSSIFSFLRYTGGDCAGLIAVPLVEKICLVALLACLPFWFSLKWNLPQLQLPTSNFSSFFYTTSTTTSHRRAPAVIFAAMNENLVERFGRSRRGVRSDTEQAQVWILPQKLNLKVRQYFEDANKPVDGGHWLSRPEIPTSAEVLDKDTGGSTSSSEVELVPNRRKGAWDSKGELPSELAISLEVH